MVGNNELVHLFKGIDTDEIHTGCIESEFLLYLPDCRLFGRLPLFQEPRNETEHPLRPGFVAGKDDVAVVFDQSRYNRCRIVPEDIRTTSM